MRMRMKKRTNVRYWLNTLSSFQIDPSLCLVSTCFLFLLKAEDKTEDSCSDVEVKKRSRRHKLLRHKLSLSEGESGDEKSGSKEKKKHNKKSGKKGNFKIIVVITILIFTLLF